MQVCEWEPLIHPHSFPPAPLQEQQPPVSKQLRRYFFKQLLLFAQGIWIQVSALSTDSCMWPRSSSCLPPFPSLCQQLTTSAASEVHWNYIHKQHMTRELYMRSGFLHVGFFCHMPLFLGKRGILMPETEVLRVPAEVCTQLPLGPWRTCMFLSPGRASQKV